MQNRKPGFTIVELLIVIVVIGILAAISIVAYGGVSNQAYDASVSSDLQNISRKIIMFEAENGRFPGGSADMASLSISVSKEAYSRGMFNSTSWYNVVYCWPNAANPKKFALVAQSKSGNTVAYMDGSVQKASFALPTSSNSACAQAGVSMDSGSNRDWFYFNDSWVSYVK